MNTKPNVILIYADDLGRGMLGCYGQNHFATPNIDRLCAEGIRFDYAYGNHMCAPARACLLSGIHDCHSGRWSFTRGGAYMDYARGHMTLDEVYELIHNTGIEQRSEDIFLPMIFGRAGYATGQIGKLEWGFSTTGDEIKAHGWEYHYGYYDHYLCHGYYPPFLFENGMCVDIEGNTDLDFGRGYMYGHPLYDAYRDDQSDKKSYSQDLFDQKIVEFISNNKDRPFFLYHPSQLPHLMLSIPEIDSRVKELPDLNKSEKEYASMVLRLDNTVGVIRETLEEYGILENTMIVFTADNGHCFYYGAERNNGYGLHYTTKGKVLDHYHVRYTTEAVGDVFDGNDGMTGCKLSNFEGGTRVPLVVCWPGKINAGTVTDRMVTNYDFMATMADLLGMSPGKNKDGKSYLGLLLGKERNYNGHEYIVYAGENGPALITPDGWKVRSYIHKSYDYGVFGATWKEIGHNAEFELYNILDDAKEEHNLADGHNDILNRLRGMLIQACDGNIINGTTQPHFAFYARDLEAW